MSRHSPFTTRHSQFSVRRRRSAFTLIELLVAVGLMALMMSMIATIFYRATQSFRMARASVEIYQNARGTFTMMTNDLVAARFCSYEDKTGYFALSWMPDPELGYPVQALTFTSLAEQTGAQPVVPGVSPQVVLVRYTLQADGGMVTVEGDDPATASTEEKYQRPTFNLVKQVRFPQLVYPFVDMNEFNSIADPAQFTPDEWVTTDVLAFGALDMKFRILYEGDYLEVVDHGRCSNGDADSVMDADKAWPTAADPDDLVGMYVRLLGGQGAPGQGGDITTSLATQIDAGVAAWSPVPLGDETTYRIERSSAFSSTLGPEWRELPDRTSEFATASGITYEDANMYPMICMEDVDGPGLPPSMQAYMPYVLEVTLDQTDSRGTRFHTFTQRIYLPASER